MNNKQIKMLRFIVKQEIEAAGIDGMEHGAWGWAEKQLDENWKEFQESFTDPDEQEYKSYDTIEELFEDLHADERLWLKKRLNEEEPLQVLTTAPESE
jgi:phosphoglycolate phosphatase-like HAD superfamily hydrolase